MKKQSLRWKSRMKNFVVLNAVLLATPLVFGLAVKHDSVAAKGCMNIVSLSQAESALARFNLTTENAKESEIRALGTGLMWIEDLNGDRPLKLATGPGSRPYPFIFKNVGKNSRQTGAGIEIARQGAKNFGSNVAQLVHELGHLVGNQGAYAMYRQHVGTTPCKVSGYSDDKFNEQFAEVFAAFVTKPELIAESKSTACKKAFKFMSQVLFATGERARNCKNNDGVLDQ